MSQRWSFVNPKVGATLQATDRLSVFASYGTTGRERTRGDLFAGADDVTPDDAPVLLPLDRVKPEHVNDLEVGATMGFDRATFTVNVFDMQFRDEIARTGATTPLGYDIRANVGRSYRRGVEVDALFALTRTPGPGRIDDRQQEQDRFVHGRREREYLHGRRADPDPVVHDEPTAHVACERTPDAHGRQPLPGPESPCAVW